MNPDKLLDSCRIVIDNRSTCEISGVLEVLNFDEYSILLVTSYGDMELEGEELKIISFSTEKGILSVSGKIRGTLYFDTSDKKRASIKRSIR